MGPGVDHTGTDLENNSTRAPPIHVSRRLLEPVLFTLERNIHSCEILSALGWDDVNLQILMQ